MHTPVKKAIEINAKALRAVNERIKHLPIEAINKEKDRHERKKRTSHRATDHWRDGQDDARCVGLPRNTASYIPLGYSMIPALMATLGYQASNFPGRRSWPVTFLEIQMPILR